MATGTVFDAEQQDRIRRIGSTMRKAAPICDTKVTTHKEAPPTKNPVKGGPVSAGKRK